MQIIYTWLTKSVFTAYIGLSLVVGDIDYFLPSKLLVSNYTAKINISSAQKPGVIALVFFSDLSNNEITNIDENTFANLPALKELYLK